MLIGLMIFWSLYISLGIFLYRKGWPARGIEYTMDIHPKITSVLDEYKYDPFGYSGYSNYRKKPIKKPISNTKRDTHKSDGEKLDDIINKL